MAEYVGAEKRIAIGSLLLTGVRLVVRSPGLLLLCLLCAIAQYAIGFFIVRHVGLHPPTRGSLPWFVMMLEAGIAGRLPLMLVQALATLAIVRAVRGESAGWWSSVGWGSKYLLSVLLLFVLISVAALCGLALLVIPGVMLVIMWLVAVPALVMENLSPLDALRRSQDLTRGSRWPIFGTYCLLALCSWGTTKLGLLIQVLLKETAVGRIHLFGTARLSNVIGIVPPMTFVTALIITVWTVLYVWLSEHRGLASTERLTDIFA